MLTHMYLIKGQPHQLAQLDGPVVPRQIPKPKAAIVNNSLGLSLDTHQSICG